MNRLARAVATALVVTMMTALLTSCAKHAQVDRSGLGLPVYPHATEVGISPALRAKSAGQTLAIYTTWDSFDAVRGWYAQTLPPETQSAVNQKRHEATFALFDDRSRTVHLEVSGGQVVIYLSAAAPDASGR